MLRTRHTQSNGPFFLGISGDRWSLTHTGQAPRVNAVPERLLHGDNTLSLHARFMRKLKASSLIVQKTNMKLRLVQNLVFFVGKFLREN